MYPGIGTAVLTKQISQTPTFNCTAGPLKTPTHLLLPYFDHNTAQITKIAFLNSPCYETPKKREKKRDKKKNRVSECLFLAPRQIYVTFVTFVFTPPPWRSRQSAIPL
jgi:hypothetical protein